MKTPILAAAAAVFLSAAAAAAAAAAVRAEPAAVAAPPGARLLLSAEADGVQIYACEAKAPGFAWVFKSPAAALFNAEGREIIHHFAGPSLQTEDGSTLVGEVVATAPSEVPGAVPWLLLRAKGRAGAGLLAKADLVRRVDTKGGDAPTAGCDAEHAGQMARIRYSATYKFYDSGR